MKGEVFLNLLRILALFREGCFIEGHARRTEPLFSALALTSAICDVH
jgi:hypothetical protein